MAIMDMVGVWFISDGHHGHGEGASHSVYGHSTHNLSLCPSHHAICNLIERGLYIN